MGVQILNKEFIDVFGNSQTFYQSNAGDGIVAKFRINESLQIQSSTASIYYLDAVNNIVQWSTGNFLNEGFRIGDTVRFSIFSYGGSLITTWTTLVTNVTINMLDVNAIPIWYVTASNEIMVIEVVTRKRESLILNINHVLNGATGNKFSLIDGETSSFSFDLNTYITGNVFNGIQVGNKSGQFAITATITDVSVYPSNLRQYDLEIAIVQSGLYEIDDFFTSNCLKLYVGFNWQSLLNEPFNNYSFIISDDANNGWFNEAFNTSLIDAVLIDGINSVDYQSPTIGQFVIDSASTDFGFGCAYVSFDSNYYKNRPFNQSQISMMLETQVFTIGTPIFSTLNEFGAGYTLTITNITTLGTMHTIDFVFTPNAQFFTFIDAREDGDKTFYIWARYGNVNLLVFDSQLEKSIPIGGELIMEQNIFFDHSENITTSLDSLNGYSANIEDDLAFTGQFLLNLNEIYESLTVKIEVFNTVTNEDFTLNSTFFNFSSVPFNTGKHLLNLVQPVQITLPTTSLKRDAILELNPSIDTPSQYGVHVYFPFLYRWEYWLQQTNADADFFPNEQNKNWFPYGNTNDWELRLNIQLAKDSLGYVFTDVLTIKDYDSEINIYQEIQLFIDATNQPVDVVIENQLMRIRATHTLINGDAWNQSNIWGQITVEPTESSPRFIASSVVPFDSNANNPFAPMAGSVVAISYPLPNVAQMECFFNPSDVDLSNGCKFTTKIKGCTEVLEIFKIMTDGTEKFTTDDENKIIA
jgi:hypothetical protein